jgi:serine/threonine protein kinase
MTNTANPATPSKGGTRRANALASGCMLDEYRIDAILGAGGFGVTYKAWDTHLETSVAIKEYFPVEWSYRDADGVTVHSNTQGDGVGGNDERLSDYLWGLERFLDEARVLARVQHPFVVRVKRYFRAHGTAYIVMDYEEGEPLNAVLQEGETLDEGEVRGLLEDVLPALQAVHEQGFLHRDIKPSNLYVRAHDHRVILIDFGAAREAVGRHSKSVTSLVTPGYSPPEQYTTRNDRYGPWTDVYALGAVLYRCVTGQPPVEAAERLLEDSLEPAARVCAGRYGVRLLRAIDRALAVRPEQRFATVAEMRDALNEPPAPDEDDDETVLLGPWLKPGGGPAREPEAPRLIKSSAPAAQFATAAVRGLGGDVWLVSKSGNVAAIRGDTLLAQPWFGPVSGFAVGGDGSLWTIGSAGLQHVSSSQAVACADCETIAAANDAPLAIAGSRASGATVAWHRDGASSMAGQTLAHPGPVTAVAATAGVAVTGGADGMVRIWDAASGRELAFARGHKGEISHAHITAGNRVVTAAVDGSVMITDVAGARALSMVDPPKLALDGLSWGRRQSPFAGR